MARSTRIKSLDALLDEPEEQLAADNPEGFDFQPPDEEANQAAASPADVAAAGEIDQAPAARADQAPAPPDVIAQATEIHRKWDATARDDLERSDSHAWGRYVRILIGPPVNSDALDLADIMAHHHLTPDQVQTDRETARRALCQLKLHADRAEAQRARLQAYADCDATEKRCKEEIFAAQMARHTAEMRNRDAEFARDELHRMARARPFLFDTSVNPPRLRCGLAG